MNMSCTAFQCRNSVHAFKMVTRGGNSIKALSITVNAMNRPEAVMGVMNERESGGVH